MKQKILLVVLITCVPINSLQVRVADKNDLIPLVNVHYHSWHALYEGMLPAEYCAKNSAGHLQQYWHKFFIKVDGRFALAAVDEDHVVGIITAGPIKYIPQEIAWWPCTDYDCEIYKLYVLPESQGKGVGQKLIEAAFEKLHTLGYRNAIVRVFSQNTGAIAFYRHCGGFTLHDEPVTYWPGLPYYVYGFQLCT